MVFNLFIEGEEPEEIGEGIDEDAAANVENNQKTEVDLSAFRVVETDPIWGDIIEVPTVYGDMARVAKKQLADTERNILAAYTKEGKRKTGQGIHRGNLLLGSAEMAPAASLEKELRDSGRWDIARYPRSAEQEQKLVGMGYAPYLKTESGEIMKSDLGLVWAKPNGQSGPQAAGAQPEAMAGPAKGRMAALKVLTDTGMNTWMSEGQNKAVIAGLMGEEWKFFADKMKELSGVIGSMPKTYDQDGMGDKAVAYLHYFRGAADWYITEKDWNTPEKDMAGNGTAQAFGLTDLGYGRELGYISIDQVRGKPRPSGRGGCQRRRTGKARAPGRTSIVRESRIILVRSRAA